MTQLDADAADSKPMSADELIKQGILDRQDEGLFAVAWAIIKLTDVISSHVSNEAIRHSNDTYTQKAGADALAGINTQISSVVSALNGGKCEIIKKPY